MKKLTATLLATAFAGLVAGTAHAEPMSAAGSNEDFINLISPEAAAVQAEFQIPASVTMGQSINETGWGRSQQTANDKNYFGYKCTSPTSHGTIAIGCHEYSTRECNSSGCFTIKAYFRVYRSMSDSFRDYGVLIARSGIYDNALPYRDNPDQFIREVAKRYATDPVYADTVINLMRANNLYRFNTGTGSSLSGDGKADIARVGVDGRVQAWRNDRGFAETPYGPSAIIATDFTNDNIHFADLDGDGKSEIARVGTDGNVVAWHNDRGFAETPYGNSAIIATEFTADNIHFADLNGDRKAEIIKVGADGNVVAWRNNGGFAPSPYGDSVIIATEFTADNIHFADLDGDGRSEIAKVGVDGRVQAWHNDGGFASSPYGNSFIIATDFTADNIHFGDLDGDRKAEIAKVGNDGKVVAWHNDRGFTETPYGNSAIIATDFTADNLHLI